MLVHCVSWEYESGGGFDWFYTPESADAVFEQEKQYEEWDRVHRFNFETKSPLPPRITEEIDAVLLEAQETGDTFTRRNHPLGYY